MEIGKFGLKIKKVKNKKNVNGRWKDMEWCASTFLRCVSVISSWQNKALLKSSSSIFLSHQYFPLFPFSFASRSSTSICLSHIASARREEWQKRREICENQGYKPRPHNSLPSSHHPCSFYPLLSLFFCFSLPLLNTCFSSALCLSRVVSSPRILCF